VNVQNVPTAGGGLPISPSADVSDGLLDLIVLNYGTPLGKYLNAAAMAKGRLSRQYNAHAEKVGWVEIEPVGRTETYIVDGEMEEAACIRLEIIPEKVRIVCPSDDGLRFDTVASRFRCHIPTAPPTTTGLGFFRTPSWGPTGQSIRGRLFLTMSQGSPDRSLWSRVTTMSVLMCPETFATENEDVKRETQTYIQVWRRV